MRYLVAATFLFSALLQFIGLGLVYNLDKTTLDIMNRELGRTEVIEERTVIGTIEDIDDAF